MILSRLLLVGLALLLSACATRPPEPQYDDARWRAQRAQLEQLTHWTLSGKLAISSAKGNGSARLYWEQQGDDYRLNLSSLIGTRIMDMRKQGSRIAITDDQGREHVAKDPGALIYQLTGWNLPVEQLPIWIKGLPGRAHYQLGTDGRLQQVRTSDWRLDYQSFQPQQGWLLPSRLELNGPGTRIRMAISQWQVRP